MVDYGRHSETERVLVSNEGLAILNLLKIQSTPFGNTGDSSGDEMNLHMPQDEESEAELKNHLAKHLDAGNPLESLTTTP